MGKELFLEDNAEIKKEEVINKELKSMFGVQENSPEAEWTLDMEEKLYGDRQPDEINDFKVGERIFGYELFQPTSKVNNIWLIAEHGHCGRARDWAKLAKIANEQGYGLLALDMHKHGKDDFEKMSMKLNEWVAVAKQAPEILSSKNIDPEKIIFLGQSSGGSAGAALAIEGKEQSPYDGMVLIGATLTNADPDGNKAVDDLANRHLNAGEDVMIDWKWMAPLLAQLKDEKLSQCYAGYLSALPGLPWRHSKDSSAVDEKIILDRLEKIDVPIIFSSGEEDTIDSKSPSRLEEVLGEKPNANIEIAEIDGAGHQAEIEKPELVMEIIKKTLTGRYPVSLTLFPCVPTIRIYEKIV